MAKTFGNMASGLCRLQNFLVSNYFFKNGMQILRINCFAASYMNPEEAIIVSRTCCQSFQILESQNQVVKHLKSGYFNI